MTLHPFPPPDLIHGRISAYDSSGGQTVVGTPVVLNLDTEIENTDPNLMTLAADVLTVNGEFSAIVDYHGTLGTTGVGDFEFDVWLAVNGAEVLGSRVKSGKGT